MCVEGGNKEGVKETCKSVWSARLLKTYLRMMLWSCCLLSMREYTDCTISIRGDEEDDDEAAAVVLVSPAACTDKVSVGWCC